MNNLENMVFLDTNGEKIEAHGGFILHYNGTYYWYGEDRRDNSYVSCYASKDLKTWENRGAIISTTTPERQVYEYMSLGLVNTRGGKVNLERPKVIYNEKTRKFVMWMHFENGIDYSVASCAIATSDYPDREFTYHGQFRPFGHMSRDCTLFIDENNAYFISASNDNFDLHVYRLSDDYLRAEKMVNKLFVGQLREAPAVFKKGERYYMLSSYCTGWQPNQCKYSYSSSIEGEWSELIDIGNYNTYHSQPSFVLPIHNDFYYFGDCWGGTDWEDIKDFHYDRSTYLIMKIYDINDKLFFDRDLKNEQ